MWWATDERPPGNAADEDRSTRSASRASEENRLSDPESGSASGIPGGSTHLLASAPPLAVFFWFSLW